jgi:hypothetical protein
MHTVWDGLLLEYDVLFGPQNERWVIGHGAGDLTSENSEKSKADIP